MFRKGFLALVLVCSFAASAFALSELTLTTLDQLPVSAETGEKPQSKVWTFNGHWWAVMPNSSGTHLWKLVGTTWTNVLTLSSATNTYADAKVFGDVVHILLYSGTSSELVSVEYVSATDRYQLWTTRPAAVSLTLDSGVETATIDIDSDGRMWLASDASTDINVRWSDSPYSTWSSAITLASSVNSDDICVVTALNGKIGVLWSNQNTQRFGFRVHTDGDDPVTWSTDEVPASQSALNVGAGMADDHLNVALASDGTLYAAVKTSYDAPGYAKVALLIRRPTGAWDDLYEVDQSGTRGIVLLNETESKVSVVYTSSEGFNDILYKESSLSTISFGSQQTLMTGGFNNATSTKQNYTNKLVILASSSTHAAGVLGTLSSQDLVGHWQMEENGGGTIVDASTFGNDGTLYGDPGWATGKVGDYALDLDGAGDYALVPDDASLDVTDAITLAAWVKPGEQDTQYLIKKAIQGSTDGYELSLATGSSSAGPGKAFVRFNQASSANDYRVNSTSDYPYDGNTWVHLAATFDGSTIRFYYNGAEESSLPATMTIASNSLSLAIGAQSDGASEFQGQIDDARVYNRALSAAEIEALATPATPPAAPTATAATNIAATGFTANWDAAAGADDYRLDVATDELFISFVSGYSDLIVPGTSQSVTGLSANTPYYYRVRAVNAAGTSDNSNTITVTTSETVEDLVGHWPMEEGSGSSVADASTYNNDGTIAGSPTWDSGIIGSYALNFNGSTDYVAVSDAVSLDITDAITLAAWIKPDQKNTLSIIKKNGGGTGYELYCGADGRVFMRLNDNNTYRAISTTLYPTNGTTWMHVAATYDGTNMKMYVNGTLEHTVAGPASIVLNDNELRIARDSAGDKYFDGQIDDARVYNRALSAAEIDVLATVLPGTPTATAATDVTNSSFTANWDAVTGADDYRLDVATDDIFTTFVPGYNDLTVASTSQSVTGLSPNTPYYYRVRAVNAAGTSDNSNTITVTTLETIENLVGHWAMEEGSGTVLIDASTYGNDANISGSPSWVAGVFGDYALDLDGSADYALAADDASLDITDAITLAAWLKPEKQGTQYILKKATQSVIDGYELSFSSSGKAFVRFNQATSENAYRLDTVTDYPYDGNTWFHLAATFDGSTIRIYVNGVEDNSTSATFAIATNGLDLAIGAQSDGVSKFQGHMDEARIYNRALSGAEILTLATPPQPEALVGYWPMEEGSGTTLVDASTYSNDATITGNPTWVPGRVGDLALDLDGATYGLVSDDPSLDITNTITLAAWVKPHKQETQHILKKAINDGGDGYELSLAANPSSQPPEGDGKVFVRFNQTTSGNTYRLNSTTTYPFDGNTWIHIAATYDGSIIRLYYNGVEENTLTASINIATNDLPFSIGSQSNGDYRLLGQIDDARVYNYALSAAEIYALANPPIVVELVSCVAYRTEDGAVAVAWTTATEINTAGFFVQRSDNAENGFARVHDKMIRARGNNTAGATYHFVDENNSMTHCYYRLEEVTLNGQSSFYAPITLSPTAAVNEEEQVPLTFALLQNYPNPFNPSTQIDYCIPQATHVTLFIYNMNGRLVKQLVNEQQKEGRYRITWDGKNDTHQHVVSGTYLYRLQAGESTAVHKMVLLK